MIEEIFSSEPCEKGQFTNDGKAILFLKRCNEEDRIQLFKCDLNGANICPMPCPKEGDITELYVSKDKPHYVIQHSGGGEVHTLTFYNIDSDEELEIMKEHAKARQLFGAWKENGFEFFEQNMDNKVEWNLRQYTVENGGETTTIENAGYFPDYIGKNNENVRFISNQHGRWYHALNGGEPQDHRIRCGKQNQNGELYCIYERADGHFANIIRLSDETNFQDIVISDEEIMKLISEDNNRIFPHGELNDFIILNNGDILLHIYKKGFSELHLKSKIRQR